jgi:hypothetical protein
VRKVWRPANASAAAIAGIAKSAQAAGRRGDWQNAAEEFDRLFKAKPITQMTDADHFNVYAAAPVFLQTGQKDKYRNLCRAALAQFGSTSAMISERTAKMCLLAEPPQDILEQADKFSIAAHAIGKNDQYLTYFEFARALACYRSNRSQAAITFSEFSLQHNKIQADYIWYHVALNHLLQAMAHHQLKDSDTAERSLKTAEQIIEQKLPKLESGELGVSWHDWLMCDLIRREAQAMITKSGAPARD